MENEVNFTLVDDKKKVRWVIQNNLIAENDLNQLQEACKEVGADVEEILVIPFSEELPEFTYNRRNVYYGSTTFMNNLYKELNGPRGLFYDDRKFRMTNYIQQWGEHMLNYGCDVTELYDIIHNTTWKDWVDSKDEKIFMRPDGDGKEFDGQVGTFDELQGMLKRTLEYDGPLSEESMILIGKAYNIHKEWRLYIVDGEIVTASRYRKDFKLSKDSLDIPEEMLTFAKERIKEYKPHDNFAMDICSTHDGTYYIIECGCLNSVGFYHADISKIVKAVTKWMTR